MSVFETRTPRPPRNGVDTPNLLGTIDAVAGQPDLAAFQFRASNTWMSGTHSRTTIDSFYGAGEERAHAAASTHDADHPAVLVGADHAPTPVEFLLHALAGCLTAGIANVAAARGVELSQVSSIVEGDIDLRGILGLSDDVRNGFHAVRVSFTVKGDAPDDVLRSLVAQSRARSAVFDVLTNGVGVSVDVMT